MCPHFFALFNKAGIACAADADHTLFQLSGKLPVAVAINPDASIPWENILREYQQSGRVRERLTMAEYAYDFSEFLASVPIKKSWKNLQSYELNLIFLGYGSQDIFPSVYDVFASTKNETLTLSEDGDFAVIGEIHDVFFNYLGNFDSVSTLIYGVSPEVRSFFLKKNLEHFQIYAERVRERFSGTEYEAFVENCLAKYDAEKDFNAGLQNADKFWHSKFEAGVDSFNIEDLVTAVETLVKSNAELMHLHAGIVCEPADVKEIAVLTIPEGLTWIKHSLYYRRNEI